MYKEYLINVFSKRIEQAKMNKRDVAKLLKISYPTYLSLLKSGNYSAEQVDILCKHFKLKAIIVPLSYLD